MQIGDLVKWDVVPDVFSDIYSELGVVLELSHEPPAYRMLSARVLFTDGSIDWINTERLEVVNESGR